MLNVKYKYNNKNINKDELVLDIETTGLNAYYDTLVLLGLVYFDNDRKDFFIDQYFAKNDKDEIRLLKIYKDKIKDKKIITYNGDIFDIPFLNIRLENYNLEAVWPKSYDIYKIIKSKRKLVSLDSMKLIDVEKKIGIYRKDPSRYKVISKLSDDLQYRDKPWPIIIHNKNDLIATEYLYRIEDYINNILSIEIYENRIYIESAYIEKDIAKIRLFSQKKLKSSYFTSDNYILEINENYINLNLLVLYGKIAKHAYGFVTSNRFNIKNISKYKINSNLITIMEEKTFNSKNILNITKSIISENLAL